MAGRDARVDGIRSKAATNGAVAKLITMDTFGLVLSNR